MNNWVKVSEKKPKDGEFVLAFIDSCFVNIAQYRNKVFFDVVKDIDFGYFETVSRDVSHWMPLPQPPKD